MPVRTKREEVAIGARKEWQAHKDVQGVCSLRAYVNQALRENELAVLKDDEPHPLDDLEASQRETLICKASADFDGSGLKDRGFGKRAFVSQTLRDAGLDTLTDAENEAL